MSKIAYDPVKDRFAELVRHAAVLRTLFYMLLDLFFLRSWYIRKVVREYAAPLDREGRWRLLDAGSGFGQYDRFLLREFSNVRIRAIDVKRDYLDDCRSYFRREIGEGSIDFSQLDLLAMEYEEEFDFTICIDVLEHIHEDEAAIGRLARSLASGGYFLMHSPSHYSEEDAGGEETFVGEHARTGYSREDITSKLRRAGLEPVEVAYTYGKPGHLAWVMLVKYPMLWFTRWKLFAAPLVLLWYLVTLLPGLILMKLDVNRDNERGTGIYALARKP